MKTNRVNIDQGVINRFEDKIYYGLDGCWYWTHSINNKGYGCLGINKKAMLAHRVSYLIHNPDVNIDGVLICHECDNPLCVNPDHLFIGTHKENTADMISKGRSMLIFNSRRNGMCKQGHALDHPNIYTYRYVTGDKIVCKICHKNNKLKRRLKLKKPI